MHVSISEEACVQEIAVKPKSFPWDFMKDSNPNPISFQ